MNRVLLVLSLVALPFTISAGSIPFASAESPRAHKIYDFTGVEVGALSCTTGVIEDFDFEFVSNTSIELFWTHPPELEGAVYEIVKQDGANWCEHLSSSPPPQVIGTTGSNSFVVSLTPPNRAVTFYVRIADCESFRTAFRWAFDTLSSLPSPPVLALQSVSGNMVNFGFSNADLRVFVYDLERSTGGGPFEFLFGADTYRFYSEFCPTGSGIFIDHDAPDGNHVYRMTGYTLAGMLESNHVAVTVGAGGPAPVIRSFSASPILIRAGESATLVWSTENASLVSISGIGNVATSGSTTVSPSSTTTYTLTATGNGSATATVTVQVITEPAVSIGALPSPMIQGTSAGGATTSFVLTNTGGAATSITLGRTQTFFGQSPGSFTLQPGQQQTVTITANQMPSGVYSGFSTISGNGVPTNQRVPVQLLVAPEPEGETEAAPTVARVDVTAPVGSNPSGTVRFTNTGAVTLSGIVASSEPWLIPPSNLITIAPGDTADIPFTIDRSLAGEGSSRLGSLTATLTLVFRTSSSGKVSASATVPTNNSSISVVDTSSPTVTSGTIPPLSQGQSALFVPGVGHVQGSVGLFISDVAIFNAAGPEPLSNVQMYYTPLGSAAVSALSSTVSTGSNTPLAVADIVKNVFNQSSQVGSLQIRSTDIAKIGLNANIFNVSNEKGFFGTTIPILRSDRSAGAGEKIHLVGLLGDSATGHTNLYFQETSGRTATVDVQFLNAAGTVVGTLSPAVTIQPFRLEFRGGARGVVPAGAVSAILTVSGDGRVSAYATPVDDLGGDTWAVVDWNLQLGMSGTTEMYLPVAGAISGRNETYFRLDAAVMNIGEATSSALLRYYPRGGTPVDKTLSLGPRQSMILEDITTDFFGIAPGTVGYIRFTPQSGTFAVTSRNFATVGEDPASYGTGVTTLGPGVLLQLGDVHKIASLEDAAQQTVDDQVPGTFRTNFTLLETAGASATVRVTLHYTYSTGTVATLRASASKDYPIGPNGFLLFTSLASTILGDQRAVVGGDLRNIDAEFAVISGEGTVGAFVSSVDSGTGDSILRTE
ncbi:MAG TPA: hypothetical protein VM534_00310 [Thermoanaerobaculia bacterium]|nr:hypothetical protein [Thermoanaerobaculia bacterium]